MRSWALLLLALCAGCGSGSGASYTPPPSLDYPEIAAKLDSFVADGTVPGYSFMLFDDAGALYTRAGGNASMSTPFFIASASKLPAVAAILTLVDDGDLDLDRPVADYIGSDIVWPESKRAITMRMLLSHSSGLEPQPACLEDDTITLKACAQQIANLALIATPGTSFAYGGGSYQVAAYIASRISGQTWQAFFSSRIGAPLGLTSFSYVGTNNPRVAGGAIANVADLSKIMRMVLAGGTFDTRRILSQAIINQVLNKQINTASGVSSPISATLYPGYTLGFFISNPVLHTSSRGPEFSDPGAFGAVPWIDVGSHYGAVILIGKDLATGSTTGLSIWNAVRPLILARIGIP